MLCLPNSSFEIALSPLLLWRVLCSESVAYSAHMKRALDAGAGVEQGGAPKRLRVDPERLAAKQMQQQGMQMQQQGMQPQLAFQQQGSGFQPQGQGHSQPQGAHSPLPFVLHTDDDDNSSDAEMRQAGALPSSAGAAGLGGIVVKQEHGAGGAPSTVSSPRSPGASSATSHGAGSSHALSPSSLGRQLGAGAPITAEQVWSCSHELHRAMPRLPDSGLTVGCVVV